MKRPSHLPIYVLAIIALLVGVWEARVAWRCQRAGGVPIRNAFGLPACVRSAPRSSGRVRRRLVPLARRVARPSQLHGEQRSDEATIAAWLERGQAACAIRRDEVAVHGARILVRHPTWAAAAERAVVHRPGAAVGVVEPHAPVAPLDARPVHWSTRRVAHARTLRARATAREGGRGA